ncbi:MAG: helix-turn-helix domain-containing protein, partial [Planctomycetota bacterium]
EVANGNFREDLYYRLNMVELQVPPLRDRVQDIPDFVNHFSQRFAAKYSRELWRPTAEQMHAFCEYSWPGNIRQLAHIIEQAYVLDCVPALPNQESTGSAEPTLPFTHLGRLRSTAVRQALQTTKGHKGRAAHLLGVHPNTLTRLLAKERQIDADRNDRLN